MATKKTQTQREYERNVVDAGTIVAGAMIAWQANRTIAGLGTTKLAITSTAVGSYFGVQIVGMSASRWIDDEHGIENWMTYSNSVFSNRTVADDIPVVGEIMSIVPNVLGVGESLWESGKMMGAHWDLGAWTRDYVVPKARTMLGLY